MSPAIRVPEAVPLVAQGTATSQARRWGFGKGTYALDRRSAAAGTYEVRFNDNLIHNGTFAREFPAGADRDTIDLREDEGVAVPMPELALRLDRGVLLVLTERSWEGVHFELVHLKPAGATVLGKEYTYLCAF